MYRDQNLLFWRKFRYMFWERPLLFCYNNEAYRPKDKGKYDTEWVKATVVDKCLCEDTGDNEALLDALTKVVGFLNEVDLSKHPPGTGNGDCSSTAPGTVGSTCPDKNGTCTYVVQKYRKGEIKVKVTCAPVTPSNGSCYKKLIHIPIGMNGQASEPNNEFRLGNVVYNNGSPKPQGTIQYYQNGTDANGGQNTCDYKYQPLMRVSAYFYDLDTNYKDPLLVVLEFKKGKDAGGKVCEYYRLITTSESGSGMKWEKEKDTGVGDKVKKPNELVKYLDEIRYGIKQILKVEINNQSKYAIQLSEKPGGAGNRFTALPNGEIRKITVVDCTNDKCSQLKEKNYKCFKHEIKQALSGIEDQVGGVAFTIPGKNGGGEKFIEIKLFNSNTEGPEPPAIDCSKGENGKTGEIKPLFYNSCMGDVYVFFYDGSSAGVSTGVDTVPLMLWYNKCYYRPCDRERYFTRWVKVSVTELKGQGPPCGSGDGGTRLVTQLNEVNRELNRIELDNQKVSTVGKDDIGYGLPETVVGSSVKPDPLKFPTDRVKVTEKQPTSAEAKAAYKRIVHRTVNGFQIGDIKYGGKEIVENGVKINGASGDTATITVKNGGSHTTLANEKGWNTVVAYYSFNDTDRKLPQLIVILKTEKAIEDGATVTGSPKTDYGYYILSSKDGGSGSSNNVSKDYEYVWRLVENGPKVTLDSATDFSLLNSVIILLDEQCKKGEESATTYNDGQIGNAIKTAQLKSPGRDGNEINRIIGKDKTIKVTTESGACLQKYGYKLCSHDFSSLVEPGPVSDVTLIAGLLFLIPCETKNEGSYQELNLSEGSSSRDAGNSYLYYQKSKTQVYLYFYQGIGAGDSVSDGTTGDPRPLMLCYNNKAYKLKDKGNYFKKWSRAKSITKCECQGGRGTGNDNKLLEELTSAVRFLNEVNLYKYPGNCNGSAVPGATTSTCNGGKDGTCSYVVHTYKGQKVTVKVECQKIGMDGSTSSSSSPSSECHYKKMIHTHNGIENGASATEEGGAKGFRLGSVKYEGIVSGSINYATIGQYKWYPLVRVTTYFYSEDKDYNSPLLVILEFQKNGVQPFNTVKEYYKLKDSGGGRLSWSEDDSAAKTIGEGDAGVVKYLDQHRYSIRKVVQIEIHSTGPYQLKGGKGTENLSRYTALNGKNIQVTECEKCSELTRHNYKCFKHDLTGRDSGIDMNDIGGLKFTVPGATGKGDIEIPLYGDAGKMETISYNKCMGDVYVYFYARGSDITKADTVPLMLYFDGKWYKPNSRDYYFKTWVQVSGLTGQGPPCGSGDGGTRLVTQLNEVNRELNRIELDNQKVSTVGKDDIGYGLPENTAGPSFNTMRVKLKKQEGPSQPPGSAAYYRVVHRTSNGFTIGDIKYNSKDFATSGVSFNGASGDTATITVKNGGSHTTLANEKGWNTVVAYYSFNDTDRKLPQLIVILKTDSELGEPVKAIEKSYGYYILSTSNSDCSYYEYTWRKVKDRYSQLTLNDITDFLLLNSAVIILDIKCKNNGNKYGDSKIKPAISSAIKKQPDISSPGLSNGEINRITGKDIRVEDATEKTEGTCLSKTGFKLITHDINELVTPNSKLKSALPNVTLIAGLRFLIPTILKDDYTELTLYNETKNVGSNNFVNVIKYHQKGKNEICVFFYKQDPRPLLFCYGGSTYKPNLKGNYFERWVKDCSVDKCKCIEGSCDSSISTCDCKNGDGLLKALVRVSDFLNQVKLDETIKIKKNITADKSGRNNENNSSTYGIHWFNGKEIKIKVELKEPENKSFCYNKYTHTAEKPGFRLGNIEYGGECIEDISTNNGRGDSGGKCIASQLVDGSPYTAASEVVTYYYKADKDHKNPLLVALCKKDGGSNGATTCTYQPYYKLQKSASEGKGKDTDPKRYTKCTDSITLSETAGGDLEKTLNRILFQISKRLQIIIDRRPVKQLYTPDKSLKCDKFDTFKKDDEGLKCLSKREYEVINCVTETTDKDLKKRCERVKKIMNFGNPDKPPTYHIPTKTCYTGKFYNGQSTSATKDTTIIVKELHCKELELHGYRCYEHDIVNAKDIYEIGWLRFYLWDNTSGGSGGAGGTNCTTTVSSASCPSAAGDSDTKCRELCLYRECSGGSTGEKTIIRQVALISVH